jgi:hypothetical protein
MTDHSSPFFLFSVRFCCKVYVFYLFYYLCTLSSNSTDKRKRPAVRNSNLYTVIAADVHTVGVGETRREEKRVIACCMSMQPELRRLGHLYVFCTPVVVVLCPVRKSPSVHKSIPWHGKHIGKGGGERRVSPPPSSLRCLGCPVRRRTPL